jgi:hypothetical protein
MSLRRLIFTGFICINFLLGAQHSWNEKWWAIWHPFAALKVKKITKHCFVIYNRPQTVTMLDKYENGGKLDCYRHMFFMAAYSQKVRSRKIRKLGIRHEKGNYKQFLKKRTEEGEIPDSLSTVMDLRNNEIGIALGNNNKDIMLEELSRVVINEINNGKGWIIKRKKSGAFTDCSGNEIDLKKFTGVWNVPKCLIPSDQAD